MEELREEITRGNMRPRGITVVAMGAQAFVHPHAVRRPAVAHEGQLAIGSSG